MDTVRARWLKPALLIAFLAAAVSFFRFTERGRQIDPAYPLDLIESHGPVAARVFCVLAYIVGTMVLLPGIVLSFVGAVRFGAYEGTLYTWIGATVGATLAFLLARVLGRGTVERLFGGAFVLVGKWLAEKMTGKPPAAGEPGARGK